MLFNYILISFEEIETTNVNINQLIRSKDSKPKYKIRSLLKKKLVRVKTPNSLVEMVGEAIICISQIHKQVGCDNNLVASNFMYVRDDYGVKFEIKQQLIEYCNVAQCN